MFSPLLYWDVLFLKYYGIIIHYSKQQIQNHKNKKEKNSALDYRLAATSQVSAVNSAYLKGACDIC